MPGQWKEIGKLVFTGARFRDHALDLSALTELTRFQRLATETAKALWRSAHPDRERLPAHFEDRTRIFLRRIEEGSAVAPLEVFVEEQQALFPDCVDEVPEELKQALDLTHQVFLSVEKDEPIPEALPKNMLPEFAEWGDGLRDDETIEILLPARVPARIGADSRARLKAIAEGPHEAPFDSPGEVLEADIRQSRFQLWVNDKTGVIVQFTADQEDVITNALRNHRNLRLRVTGQARYSPNGKPLSVFRVDRLDLLSSNGPLFHQEARSIEDELAELAAAIPSNEWSKLPSDLSANLDQYIYGTPKK